jgi:hypothetical protein
MSDETAASPAPAKKKRPVLVWIISIACFLIMGRELFSFASAYCSYLPMHNINANYYFTKTIIYKLVYFIITLLFLFGAIYLFLLKRKAFNLFLFTLFLKLTADAYYIFFQSSVSDIITQILIKKTVYYSIEWCVAIAIILYIRKLIDEKTLQ